MPQPCSSRRLVLTLDRATPRVAAISSACSGRGDRKSRAWIWATVRLMPQRAPISPQVTTKRCWIGLRALLADLSVISVLTEHYDKRGWWSNSQGRSRKRAALTLAIGIGKLGIGD